MLCTLYIFNKANGLWTICIFNLLNMCNFFYILLQWLCAVWISIKLCINYSTIIRRIYCLEKSKCNTNRHLLYAQNVVLVYNFMKARKMWDNFIDRDFLMGFSNWFQSLTLVKVIVLKKNTHWVLSMNWLIKRNPFEYHLIVCRKDLMIKCTIFLYANALKRMITRLVS